VVDTERGGFFTSAYNNEWENYGANFSTPSFNFSQMSAASIKGVHGRLQHFGPDDEPPNFYAGFPWTQFQDFILDEIRQGRRTLNIKGNYLGQLRPLFVNYGSPQDFDYKWQNHPVDIQDERFVKFFVKQYVRPIVLSKQSSNAWMGADNCTFRRDLYGAFNKSTAWKINPDQSGSYTAVSGDFKANPANEPSTCLNDRNNVCWDSNIKTDSQWVSANINYLNRLKTAAPELRIVCNDVGLNESQRGRFPEFMNQLNGVIREDFWYFYDVMDQSNCNSYCRQAFAQRISDMATNGEAGRIEIHQFPIAANNLALIKKSFLMHILVAGPNFFFGPKDSSNTELNPDLWADIRNKVGRPVSPLKSTIVGSAPYLMLYERETEGGICFLNASGSQRTIPLSGRNYYSLSGQAINSLTINDRDLDCALFNPGTRTSWPSFWPRYSSPVSGPVTVNLKIDPRFSTGANIYYTTDGSEPTQSSNLYSGPFTLNQSTVVKAKAYRSGRIESFTNFATYNITGTNPIVEFDKAAESGSEFLKNDYPLIKLNNPSNKPVTVNYSVIGGSASNGSDFKLAVGTITISPGDRYKSFPIPIINDGLRESSETIIIGLTSAQNASIGVQATYQYTIEDND
jgi:hypothetical protein